MTIIKTPFGEYDTDNGKLAASVEVVDTPTKPSPPPAPDPLSLTYTDPSVCHTDEARSDLEALRFTQMRRLIVIVNGVTLAHRFWQARADLENWEQGALADDRRKLMNFRVPSSGDNKVKLVEVGSAVTEADVKAIAAAFPRRRVYWKGAEVTA